MNITAVKRKTSIERDLMALNATFVEVMGKTNNSEEVAIVNAAKAVDGKKKAVLLINRHRLYGNEATRLKEADIVVLVDSANRKNIADMSALFSKVIEVLGGAKVSMTAYKTGHVCLVARRGRSVAEHE